MFLVRSYNVINMEVPVKSWWSYVMLIESYSIVIINSIAIYAVTRNTRSKSICNMFLTGLFTSHFCTGIIGSVVFTVEFVVNRSALNETNTYEKIITSLFCGSFIFTYTCVALVTLDRLLAVRFLFRYERLNKKFVVCSYIIAIIIPIVYIILTHTGYISASYHVFVMTGCTVCIGMAISNVIIYRQVRRQYLHILATIVAFDDIAQKAKEKRLRQRRLRSVRICVFIVCSFTLLWLPVGVWCLILMYVFTDKRYYVWSPVFVYLLLNAFLYMNSMIDPIIYISINREAKVNIRKIFRKTIINNIPSSSVVKSSQISTDQS